MGAPLKEAFDGVPPGMCNQAAELIVVCGQAHPIACMHEELPQIWAHLQHQIHPECGVRGV